MADKTQMTVSESFASQDEQELCENVQRIMEEYVVLCAKGRAISGTRPERE